MTDRTKNVFGNPIDRKTVKKAEKSKAKYLKKYGDDSKTDYRFAFPPIGQLSHIGARNIVSGDGTETMDGKPLIVGNIRMGFGHYRISIAMASCARALGFTPYWLDLASFDATGSKMLREQNDLYSLASRTSQKSPSSTWTLSTIASRCLSVCGSVRSPASRPLGPQCSMNVRQV